MAGAEIVQKPVQNAPCLGVLRHTTDDRRVRLAEEERKSEALGVPVVLMLLAWVGFLGYPALVNIIGL